MRIKSIKIWLMSFLICLVFSGQGMHQPGTLRNNLEQLIRSLNALEIMLKKGKKPEKRELSLSKFDQEALEILLAEAQRRGIPFNEYVMNVLLKTGEEQPPREGVPTQIPFGPGAPPPPPPPAPPVEVIKVKPLTITPGKGKKEKPQQQPGLSISSEDIGVARRGLRSVVKHTAQAEAKSDEQFLNAFRSANTIDEIIAKLQLLADDPLYLKKESLKEASKIPLPKSGSLPAGYQVKKIMIPDLLNKKNRLVLLNINPEADYLNDYMFNTALFTDEDYNHLEELIKIEIESKKALEAEKELEREKEYKPWQETLQQVIVNAGDLNHVIKFIRAFPRQSKFLPNIIIKEDKGGTFYVAIGSDDLRSLNTAKEKLNESPEAFVQELKKHVSQDEQNKLDQLLKALKE